MNLGAGRGWRHIAVLTLCIFASGAAVPACAAPISVGIFWLVTTDPGVVGFEIDNNTGPAALPDDFPVVTTLTFTSLNLSYVLSHGSASVPVPDVGPGPAIATTLPDSTEIYSASLVGVLAPSTFLLSDGSSWRASSSSFFVELQPQSGSTLTPGDFSLITVEAEPEAAVPEPATALLVLAGLGLMVLIRR